MAARMKVEDWCCKTEAVQRYDLFRPKRTVVTILSFFLAKGDKKQERLGRRKGSCSQTEKRGQKKYLRGRKEEREAFCIGVVKAVSFQDIIYLTNAGPEQRRRQKPIDAEGEIERGRDSVDVDAHVRQRYPV